MVDITVTVNYDNNFTNLQDIIANAPEELKRLVIEALDWGGYEITADAKARAPKKTGYLISQIGHTVTANGIVIYCGAPYASYQEKGTKYIEPKLFMYQALIDNIPMIDAEISHKIIGYFEGGK